MPFAPKNPPTVSTKPPTDKERIEKLEAQVATIMAILKKNGLI